ncbi:MAG: ABC transporter permease, partial [Steroidobacteraceae bacterium]
GAALVTIVGVTTVVGVLVSLLAMSTGAQIFSSGAARPDEAIVLGAGTDNAQTSVLGRDALLAVMGAPGVKRASDGSPYVTGVTLVGVDLIKKDGRRGGAMLIGYTPGIALIDSDATLIAGRMYRPGLHELVVSDTVRRMYRGLDLGDRINLRGTEWTIVGVLKATGSLNDSTIRGDAATIMAAFGRTVYQDAIVVLDSPASYDTFKSALMHDPAIQVKVQTAAQNFAKTFGQLTGILNFVAYFIGAVMASGAICGALNSLYASVDARRREIATLRAIGFNGAPVVVAVLAEGMLLALPGAFLGAGIAWFLFNGHSVGTSGLIFRLTVTPHLLVVSIFWALAIGLIGGSLPALRAARLPVASALRAT